jgi:hypothetical protein
MGTRTYSRRGVLTAQGRAREAQRAGGLAATPGILNTEANSQKSVDTEFGPLELRNRTPDQLNNEFIDYMSYETRPEPFMGPFMGNAIVQARDTGVAQIPEGVNKKSYIDAIVFAGNTIIAPSARLSSDVQNELYQFLNEVGNRLANETYDYNPEDSSIEAAMVRVGARNMIGEMLLRIRREAGSANNLTPKFLAERLNFDDGDNVEAEYGFGVGPNADSEGGNTSILEELSDIRSGLSYIMNGV